MRSGGPGPFRSLVRAATAFALAACSTSAASDGGAGPPLGPGEPVPTASPLVACAPTALTSPDHDFFADISASSGITARNFVTAPPKPIPINDHSRLGFVDIDGDGFDDIVAHSLFPNPQAGIPFEHLVFRNRGDKTFEDVSEASGLGSVQAAFFVFGDVDNDGDQDCFAGLDIQLGNETSALYLNDGKGHFTKKEGSGVAIASLAANAVFADFDNDGRLDLYVGNGGTTTPSKDQLFLGNGDGTFSDGSKRLANRPLQPTNGVVACDYDDDGDLDILVSHYGVSVGLGWRTLWENDGAGGFVDVAKERGFHALATGNSMLASTGKGKDAQSSDPTTWVGSNGFGIDCQDVDGDGHMDIWLAAISHPVDEDASRKWSDPSQLFLNKGPDGGFGFAAGTLDRKIPFNEGDIDAAAIDFDNDGRVDLSVTRDKKYEGNYTKADQKAWLGLFWQAADGTFANVGLTSGINDMSGATDRVKAGQNLAWADIDNDGDLDLLVGGRDNGGGGRANFLFENGIGHRNGWLGVRLRGDGVKVNRDAIGARVTLTVGDKKAVREVKSARGTYGSMDGRKLLFGLGDAGCIEEGGQGRSRVGMTVRWPDGKVDTFPTGSFPLNGDLVIDYTRGIVPR